MAIQRDKNELWEEIGNTLNNRYRSREKAPRYFHRQQFNTGNFLGCCTPYNEIFFGTKTYHIIIINKPYDVEDSNFLNLIAESKDYIIRNFKKFQRYWVDIWVDMTVADRIAEDNAELKGKLEDVQLFCQTLCSDMAEYGFIYQGILTEDMNINANFFDTYIQDFWKQNELPT